MEGLIYKVQPYKENTKLLFIYTMEGKRTLVAHSALKLNHPNRILSQYLTLIAFKDQKKNMMGLSDAKLIDSFESIKSDYEKTQSAAIILEILDKLVDESLHHAIIYPMAKKALMAQSITVSSLMFAIKIQKQLGYQIDLSPDGRTIKGINIEKGGLTYEGESYRIDLDTQRAIDVLKLNALSFDDEITLSIESMNALKHFMYNYIEHHLQTPIKNLK